MSFQASFISLKLIALFVLASSFIAMHAQANPAPIADENLGRDLEDKRGPSSIPLSAFLSHRCPCRISRLLMINERGSFASNNLCT